MYFRHWERNPRCNMSFVRLSYVSAFVHVFGRELDAKVTDFVYGSQRLRSRNVMFQPLQCHLQGVYLIHYSSKFNEMSKIQLSV